MHGKSNLVRIVIEGSARNMPWLLYGWVSVGDVATIILSDQYNIILVGIVDPLPLLVHLVESDLLGESELHAVVATCCCLEHFAKPLQREHFDLLAIGECRQIGVWVSICQLSVSGVG
jgi:hypothetical protein